MGLRWRGFGVGLRVFGLGLRRSGEFELEAGTEWEQIFLHMGAGATAGCCGAMHSVPFFLVACLSCLLDKHGYQNILGVV